MLDSDLSHHARRGLGRRRARAATLLLLAAAVTACSDGLSETTSPTTAVRSPSFAGPRPLESAVAPASMARSRPVRVRIPAIGVNTRLIGLGLRADGAMEVPPNGFPAGWYTGAPTPGEIGPAIIAGHVHWAGRPGVFAALGRLKPGNLVEVSRKDGSTAVFRVTKVQQFTKKMFPTALIYGDIDVAGLRLITCGGFDPKARTYESNTVAFAELLTQPSA